MNSGVPEQAQESGPSPHGAPLRSSARPGPDLALGLGFGLIGALASVAAAQMGFGLLAIALPLLAMLGALAISRPETGALVLIFIAYLDGVSDMILDPNLVSGFEVFTAITMVSILINAHRMRPHLRAVFADPIAQLTVCFLVIWALAIFFALDRTAAANWGKRLFLISLTLFLVMITLRTTRAVALAVRCLALTTLISSTVLILDLVLNTHLIATTPAATGAVTSGGFNRSSGASQANPTTAATMMLTGTVVALVHAIESPKARRFMLLAAFVGSLATVLSFARSAFLVYAIVLGLIAVRYAHHRSFPAFAAIAALIAIAMLPLLPPELWQRVGTIFAPDASGDWTLGRRLTYNLIGLKLLAEYPVLGIGPGNFFGQFTDPDYRYLPGRTLGGRQLHNMYLSVMVEYGLLGFGIFIAIVYRAFRVCAEVIAAPANDEMRVSAIALRYGMMAYFLTCCFLPSEYIKYTWILPGLAAALGLVNTKNRTPRL